VILNPKNAEGKDTNKPYAAQLTTEGVSVKYSRTITPGGGQHYDETHFRFDHSKIILADEGTPNPKALVMTINLGPGYLGKPSKEGISLNFGLVDTKVADNTYLEDIFDCDWNATPAPKPIATDLLISPLNSRTELISQIKNAKKSFHFFNQELGDKLLIAALVSAARRGVEVKGLVSPNLVKQKNIQGIKDAGGEILALADPYEHAKAAIADGKVSYVGSINYTKSSFDENREVGILTDQQDIATALEGYFFKFWPQGQQITTQ
jgi:phosphatidylserine/phosphatidylglycerophosphate/cardiolipin synthase-like enzyme